MFKRMALVVLALALALPFVPAGAEEAETYIGRRLADFTVDTAGGEPFSLYEALEDHDLALINLWATWCGYCTLEFPYLQAAYEQYGDRVAVIALSIEPEDTDGVMADYAQNLGLTFPVGSDVGLGLSGAFNVRGVPTSIVVDKQGYVAYVVTGAMPSEEAFAQLFDYFLDQVE